jgi:hypothetical protein
VGNFGNGAVYKLTFNDDGTVKENKVWARNPVQLKSTDGMTQMVNTKHKMPATLSELEPR